MHSLKHILTADNCFGSVHLFELDGLNGLEAITIEQKIFTFVKTEDDVDNHKRANGSYRIMDCPKLVSIQIGSYAFADYYTFELTNLPSLESIQVASHCFYHASSFSLTGAND